MRTAAAAPGRARSRSTALSVEGVQRCVHCGLCLAVLPDVLRAGHGDGLAARPHLPDQVAGRGPHRARATPRWRTSTSASAAARARRCAPPACRTASSSRRRARRSSASAPAARCAGCSAGSNFTLLLAHPRLLGLAAAGAPLLPGERAPAARARLAGLLRLLPGPLASWEPLLPELPPRGRPRAAAAGDPRGSRRRAAPSPCSPAASSRSRSARRTAPPRACWPERRRGARAPGPGLLRRAPRPRGRARHGGDAGQARHRGVRGGRAPST